MPTAPSFTAGTASRAASPKPSPALRSTFAKISAPRASTPTSARKIRSSPSTPSTTATRTRPRQSLTRLFTKACASRSSARRNSTSSRPTLLNVARAGFSRGALFFNGIHARRAAWLGRRQAHRRHRHRRQHRLQRRLADHRAGANVGSNNSAIRNLFTVDDHVYWTRGKHQLEAGVLASASPVQRQPGPGPVRPGLLLHAHYVPQGQHHDLHLRCPRPPSSAGARFRRALYRRHLAHYASLRAPRRLPLRIHQRLERIAVPRLRSTDSPPASSTPRPPSAALRSPPTAPRSSPSRASASPGTSSATATPLSAPASASTAACSTRSTTASTRPRPTTPPSFSKTSPSPASTSRPDPLRPPAANLALAPCSRISTRPPSSTGRSTSSRKSPRTPRSPSAMKARTATIKSSPRTGTSRPPSSAPTPPAPPRCPPEPSTTPRTTDANPALANTTSWVSQGISNYTPSRSICAAASRMDCSSAATTPGRSNLDDGSAWNTSVCANTPAFVEYPANPRVDYGTAATDIRQLASINGTWNCLPAIRCSQRRRASSRSGWSPQRHRQHCRRVSPSRRSLATTPPATATRATPSAPTCNPAFHGPLYTAAPSAQWFNPAAFSAPYRGHRWQSSAATRSPVPAWRSWTSPPVKTTTIHERCTLQFRAEFFNILNHANFTTPNPVVYSTGPTPTSPATAPVLSPTAGVITATSTTSRQIQFGLKLLF